MARSYDSEPVFLRDVGFAFGAAGFAFVAPAPVVLDLAFVGVPAAFDRVALRVFDAVDLDEALVVDGGDFVVDFAADVDRRRFADFVVPIGKASPTAFMAALAASPTVSTTFPAVLPTVPAVRPAVLPTVPAVFPTVRPTDFTTLPGSGIGYSSLVRR